MYYIDNNDIKEPWLNLALEEYAVRNLDRSNDYLLMYINQPSVIIGKHQNILEEVNLVAAGEAGIPVVRRISGGGTVYHDSGNLNISVITNQTLKNFNKYVSFLKPVLEVLKELGLDVHLNERNNIILKDKKLSGNAQFSSRQRLLSHGTLLVNSDLEMMDKLLKPENSAHYNSKSTKSVRSQVSNISNQLERNITSEEIKQKILGKIYNRDMLVFKMSKKNRAEIENLAETKYKSWQWNYGLSPKCIIKKVFLSEIGEIRLEVVVENGFIQSLSIRNPKLAESQKELLHQYFFNKPLDYKTIKIISENVNLDHALQSFKRLPWLDILLN